MSEQAWQIWWVRPWLDLGAGWLPAPLSELSLDALHCWAEMHPLVLGRALQVSVENAPIVAPWLRQLMLATPSVRREAFERMRGIYCVRARDQMDYKAREWCERVARGVRPAPLSTPISGEVLLCRAVGPWLWSRVRLSFAREDACFELQAAADKLPLLWAAALWQAQYRDGGGACS